MFKTYKYSDEVIYIPLVLNMMVFKSDFCANNNRYLSRDFLLFLEENSSYNLDADIIILDFNHIILGEPASLKSFCAHLNQLTKLVIYCNVNAKIYALIEAAFIDSAYGSIDDKVISTSEGYNYYLNSLKPFNKYRNLLISNIVRLFIKNTCLEEETFLPSSNLYANKYINIKNIFTEQNINYLVLLQMFNLISEHIDENHYDKLVCVSLNGAVIATLIGQIVNKEVIYLMNLGPNLNIRDKESLTKIKVKGRYLFVADMLCTGTELKIAETILNYRNANIVGAVVVAQYLKAMSSMPVHYILDIMGDDDFNYKVYTKTS